MLSYYRNHSTLNRGLFSHCPFQTNRQIGPATGHIVEILTAGDARDSLEVRASFTVKLATEIQHRADLITEVRRTFPVTKKPGHAPKLGAGSITSPMVGASAPPINQSPGSSRPILDPHVSTLQSGGVKKFCRLDQKIRRENKSRLETVRETSESTMVFILESTPFYPSNNSPNTFSEWF